MSRVLNCRYEIEYKSGGGVVGVVQRMKFRHTTQLCLDYMQTIYKSDKKSGNRFKHKKKKDKIKKVYKIAKEVGYSRQKRDDDDEEEDRGPRLCGDVLYGLHVDQNETLPPPFASPLPPNLGGFRQTSLFSGDDNPYVTLTSEAADVDPKGELQTHLYVSNRMLRVNETISISIVYSAYKVCDGNNVQSSMFHCGYGLCISRSLTNDGFVNCPFGDCIDEGNCTNAKNSVISAKIIRYKPMESTSSSGGETSLKTILTIAAVVIVIAAAYYFIKKRKDKKKKEEEEDEGEEMEGEFQDPSKVPSQPPPPGYPPQGQPGYPPQGQPGYPPQGQPGYPPQGQPGYPPQGQPGYPPQGQPGYPPQGQPGYPPQGQPGYPPQGQPGYPPQGQPGYPPQGQPGYPPLDQPGYPPQGQPGYPPQGQPGYPPQGQPGYPPQGQPGYPPQGEAGYPPPQGSEATSTIPLQQGVPPPLPDGAIGFNMPPTAYPGAPYPGVTPAVAPPPGGQTSAPSAPDL